jgi:cysteinyl-tRNA synthetase
MTPIRLYNTLTRRKEVFEPMIPGRVGFYSCGLTVYDYGHIGNFRTYVFSDVLRRVLEYNGIRVRQVMNVTDVGHLVSDADEGEDKMLEGAKREKKTPLEIAEHYTQDFFKNMAKLNILTPHVVCKATEHIPEMIALVQTLVDKGFAYETSDGIYFDIQKFPSYGRLSGFRLDKQEAGARVEVRTEKRHPADFALWKKADPKHLMQWPSPWGQGFPGWHIECSAMSMKYLGETFEIHTGGEDHIPIHHENEIAQSEAATGKPFVRVWMHGAFLQVDGGKMSKSLRNFYRVDDLEAKGFEPLAFRYFCLSGHYRSPLNFTWESLSGAQNALRNLREDILRLKKEEMSGIGFKPEDSEALKQRFLEAVNDDLNMPQGLAVAWEAVRMLKGEVLWETLLKFDEVLGLGFKDLEAVEKERSRVPPEIQALVREREEARRTKDWVRADELRKKAQGFGFILEDNSKGTMVRKDTRE